MPVLEVRGQRNFSCGCRINLVVHMEDFLKIAPTRLLFLRVVQKCEKVFPQNGSKAIDPVAIP